MSDLRINTTSLASADLNPARPESSGVSPGGQLDFGELVKRSLDSVNDTQQQAGKLAEQFELGNPNVDLVRVMVEMQKARVSFEAVSQVRNKLVEAYREIMNMQV